MKGQKEAAAYMRGMAYVFSLQHLLMRREVCDHAAVITEQATDLQSLTFALTQAARAQDSEGLPIAAQMYDECLSVVRDYCRK